jgi:hydrogenase maturation protein HypF
MDSERRAITVQGVVQGVGFRPFAHALATRLGLTGFVRNDAGAVQIEVEGSPPALEEFFVALTRRHPPLARIAGVRWEPRPVRGGQQFVITTSATSIGGPVFISPDVATCNACVAELFDPADRRFRYPFLNCTDCGPRLTIIAGAPYDRGRTTMAAFQMCGACRAEYDDPADRRFHAQPTCCPACGPRLTLRDARGEVVPTADPLTVFAAALCDERIGALKGLGGYHLACDARRGDVVAELRRRKHRDEKPFAVMVADADAAASLCEISPAECEFLRSPRRPIVLLRKRPGCGIADAVAPGNPFLGVMLAYTPLHHLLLHEVAAPW